MKSRWQHPSVFNGVWIILLALGLPVGAAPLTNTVPVTKDLYFQLSKEFGPVTNRFSAAEPICFGIQSFITNKLENRNIFYRYFPLEQSFVFKLYDRHGEEVERTMLGRQWSEPPVEPTTMRQASDLKGYRPPSVQHLYAADQMFVMPEAGVYEMEVSIRLWVQTTNTGTPNELEGYLNPAIGTNYLFGVVTSPPVRVEVTKK